MSFISVPMYDDSKDCYEADQFCDDPDNIRGNSWTNTDLPQDLQDFLKELDNEH